MTINEVTEEEQSKPSFSLTLPPQGRELEIVDAPGVRLQTLDLARHMAIAPDGKRYIVATYNDTHMGRHYVTALYPQQNGYLTLIRLMMHEVSSETPEQALQVHVEWVQAIQQGKLNQIVG